MTETDSEGKPLINTQQYKLAAPGCGFILYHITPENQIRVLLSMRSAEVGEGLGITGGGYVDCGPLNDLPHGTIWEAASEAFRENTEENIGFGDVITREYALENYQVISAFTVSKDVDPKLDPAGVHSCTFMALHVKSAEDWETVKNLRGSSERKGALIDAELKWTSNINRLEPEQQITFVYKPGSAYSYEFHHSHELRAFGSIAWHAEHGLLWGQLKD